MPSQLSNSSETMDAQAQRTRLIGTHLIYAVTFLPIDRLAHEPPLVIPCTRQIQRQRFINHRRPYIPSIIIVQRGIIKPGRCRATSLVRPQCERGVVRVWGLSFACYTEVVDGETVGRVCVYS